ncbi:hypothetical protein KJ633_06620 [bacterium]|nr:hypothetical protein [bacterium]MBU3956119.1 hypothetical protein [bacterium]
MKRILTHLAAFIAGIIALPLGIFITVKVAPNALPGLCRKVTAPKRNIKRGVAALKTAKTERESVYNPDFNYGEFAIIGYAPGFYQNNN